jgi:DNA (cytosine-5)-methyltransferase 1
MKYAEIKEKRKKYNISQTKLSEASGYSKAAISAWELEKCVPSDYELSRLDEALSVIIKNIEECIFDVRKKRITHSKLEKRNLPPPINSADDYRERLSLRTVSETPYSKRLSDLYHKAQKPKGCHAPKAIALFSGCGGLSLGFAAEGFNLVGHVEIEKSANRIYEENFPESRLIGTDICEISDNDMHKWISEYGNIDVIVGGPPCQGFSLAGKRDPEDLRNQLYKYYVHIVSVLQPKVFVMENVRLLTSMKNSGGRLFIDCILESFSKAGYHIIRREINACDYGVPQSRERVILIGIRNDLNKEFVFPIGEYTDDNQVDLLFLPKKRLSFRDAAGDLQPLESGDRSSDPLHWSIAHPEHVIKWLKDVPEGCSAHENKDPAMRPPSGFNTTYKRIMWDEPCSTISTNFSMISGCRNVHPTSTRSLSIREAARIQSFPDEFVFVGKWGDIRKAIGNAVPPVLAAAIARAILNQLFMN